MSKPGDELTSRFIFAEASSAPDPLLGHSGGRQESDGGLVWHDRRPRFASVMVTATNRRRGWWTSPCEIDVARARPAREPAPEVAG